LVLSLADNAHSIFLFRSQVGTLAMMMKLSLNLTVACLIGAPLILIVAKISGNAHRRISEKVQDLSADGSEIAEETIQTIRTVRSFGNEDGELKRYADILQQAYKASWIQAAISAGQKWFVEVSRLFEQWISRQVNISTLNNNTTIVLTTTSLMSRITTDRIHIVMKLTNDCFIDIHISSAWSIITFDVHRVDSHVRTAMNTCRNICRTIR
jgi:ABC-type multidrug transport system fused ATPase/permease subunit